MLCQADFQCLPYGYNDGDDDGHGQDDDDGGVGLGEAQSSRHFATIKVWP